MGRVELSHVAHGQNALHCAVGLVLMVSPAEGISKHQFPTGFVMYHYLCAVLGCKQADVSGTSTEHRIASGAGAEDVLGGAVIHVDVYFELIWLWRWKCVQHGDQVQSLEVCYLKVCI